MVNVRRLLRITIKKKHFYNPELYLCIDYLEYYRSHFELNDNNKGVGYHNATKTERAYTKEGNMSLISPHPLVFKKPPVTLTQLKNRQATPQRNQTQTTLCSVWDTADFGVCDWSRYGKGGGAKEVTSFARGKWVFLEEIYDSCQSATLRLHLAHLKNNFSVTLLCERA